MLELISYWTLRILMPNQTLSCERRKETKIQPTTNHNKIVFLFADVCTWYIIIMIETRNL